MKIGTLELCHGLFLAPLAGVSDRAFRDTCRRFGAEYTVSEMISSKALVYEQKSRKNLRTAPLASVFAYEMPMAVQLFGAEPETMALAARMIAECSYRGCASDTAPAAIDINMGCPVPKVVGNGEGSALLRDPELAGQIVRAVVDAVKLPVTVKIRAGWDAESVNAPEIAKILEASGAAAIAVHGRTRAQMYAPGSDNSIIRRVKESVSIPVIGNGDIYTADDALRMFRETGCDGVMIARGALGNPFLFSEIRAALEEKAYSLPTLRERLETALGQVRDMVKDKDERIAIAEARKHLSWYIKGIPGAAGARDAINRATTYAEMEDLLWGLCAEEKQ